MFRTNLHHSVWRKNEIISKTMLEKQKYTLCMKIKNLQGRNPKQFQTNLPIIPLWVFPISPGLAPLGH